MGSHGPAFPSPGRPVVSDVFVRVSINEKTNRVNDSVQYGVSKVFRNGDRITNVAGSLVCPEGWFGGFWSVRKMWTYHSFNLRC